MFFLPQTKKECLELKFQYESNIAAIMGGTDLTLQIRAGRKKPEHLMGIGSVLDMAQINQTQDSIEIGSAVTIADIARFEPMKQHPQVLKAILSIGSPQIRNFAGIGGNICNASPSADAAVALLTTNASCVIESKNSKRVVLLKKFFTGPGKTVLKPNELLTLITIPKLNKSNKIITYFKKYGKRKVNIIATVNFAFLLELDNKKIVRLSASAGSVAPTPIVFHTLSQWAKGKIFTRNFLSENQKIIVEKVMNEISPISDVRGSKEYKSVLVKNSIITFLKSAIEEIYG